MNSQNKKSFITYIAVIVAILVIVNVVSRNLFFRWDLTNNKEHSLSSSSKSIIGKIDDYLTIKAYFSDNLPHQLANTRRFVQDKLEDYAAYSNSNIHFEFIRDDEKLKEEAQKSGIQPLQVQVLENDAFIVKQIYMGLELLYEDNKEIIPVIQQEKLEYDITTKIKKLVDTNKQTIAIAKTSSQTDIKNESVSQLLSQHYTVRSTNLDQEVPGDITLILLNGLEDSLASIERHNLEAFIGRGGNILLAQNRIKTDLSTQQANSIESDIFTILDSYGLHIEPNLVLDLNCGKVNVQQNLGFIRIPVPMDYPFLPIIKESSFNDDMVMVSGLETLRLMFPSELTYSDSLFNIIPLFKSSNQSTTMQEFFNLNPDPNANPSFRQLNENGKTLGAVAEVLQKDSGILSQIILITDSKFISDDGGGGSSENHIFIMNAVDYLLGDRELIALRSREITSRPLEELEDAEKSRWKWINILMPSILIVGFGFIRLKRENNRAKVLEEIYD